MERELWPVLYRLLRATAKDFHQKYVQIPAWVVIAVLLWAALHDRPVSWACQKRHWSTTTLQPWRCRDTANRADRGHHLAATINTDGWHLSKAMVPRNQGPSTNARSTTIRSGSIAITSKTATYI